MSQSKVKLTVEDDVAVITLSDPATMNAAGLDMVQELGEAAAFSHRGAVARSQGRYDP